MRGWKEFGRRGVEWMVRGGVRRNPRRSCVRVEEEFRQHDREGRRTCGKGFVEREGGEEKVQRRGLEGVTSTEGTGTINT